MNGCTIIRCSEYSEIIVRKSNGTCCKSLSDVDKIKSHWEKAYSKNPKLFNGEIFSADFINYVDKYILVTVVETDYAHYLCTKDHEFLLDSPCCTVAFGAIIITNDNYFVFGKMANHTSFPGIIQCIGGGIDKSDTFDGLNGYISPTKTILREIKEEIGLTLSEPVKPLIPGYIITRDDKSMFGACYTIKINIPLNEVINIYNRYNASEGFNGEIENVIHVKRNSIAAEEFLSMRAQRVDYLEEIIRNETSETSAVSNLCEVVI